jgi:ribosomal protein S18 acetylase RimI-like enzyme
MIRLMKESEYDIWIEIAKEVEYLFGPMVKSNDFKKAIKECIKNNNAFCSTNHDYIITGIIALDRVQNEISWLAVKKQFRGNNYGNKLIKKAISELIKNGDIKVQTFSENCNEGKAARKIYLKNGFVDLKEAGGNPAGLDTVIMVKKS